MRATLQVRTGLVDTHAHFWDWPSEPGALVRAREIAERAPHAYGHGPMLVDDLLARMDGTGVDTVLQVTPAILDYDNTQSLEGAARHADRIRVIARVDPRDDRLEHTLALLDETGLVVGLRMFTFEPEAAVIASNSMDRYCSLAADHGMAVSIYAPSRPADLRALVQRHLDTRFVLDHLGVDLMGQPTRQERQDTWRAMLRMSELPNVAAKLSCLPELLPHDEMATLGASMVREVVDAYGASRVMWGSNFPPAGRAGPYDRLAELAAEQCAFLDAEEIVQVMGATAARTFELPWSHPSGPVKEPSSAGVEDSR